MTDELVPVPVKKRSKRVRRTLHVEQEVTSPEGGKIRRLETTHAREEKDGQVTEIEREEVAYSSEESPWFSEGTVRERVKVTKPGE